MFDISNSMERIVSLGEYLKMKLAEYRLSNRDVAANSQNGVSSTTINELSNGKGGSPSVGTLQAIARGFKRGVGFEEELFRVARGLPINPEDATYTKDEAKLLSRWERLDVEQRKAVLRFMNFQLLETVKGTDEFTDEEIRTVMDADAEV